VFGQERRALRRNRSSEPILDREASRRDRGTQSQASPERPPALSPAKVAPGHKLAAAASKTEEGQAV